MTRSHDDFPFGATARRRTWDQLPDSVRQRVEAGCGSAVKAATSVTSGFTPGFASVLTLDSGHQVFIKAAGRIDDERHGWPITGSYREEARKRAALPDDLPAPRLLWSDDDGDWIVNGFEYIDGHLPRRPWYSTELDIVVATLTDMAELLDPAPAGLELSPAADFFENMPESAAAVRERDGWSPELDRLIELATQYPQRAGGSAVVHFDVRDDNILITGDDRALICDWNWPRRGASWLDLIGLLFSVHGDGLDADEIVRTNSLTRDVEPQSIDAFLAALWLYFTTQGDQPAPEFSPHLREFQRLQGDWVLSWLRSRSAV
jgi:hypothetical protein